MLDNDRIRALVLGSMNDVMDTEPYRGGFIVTPNLHYADGDAVEVFVETYGQGYRINDRGASALRLQMAGVNLDSSKVRTAWAQSVPRDAFDTDPNAGEVATFATEQQAGGAVLAVAESMVRLDQLRYLAPQPKAAPFKRTVAESVRGITPRSVEVKSDFRLRIRGGAERLATAAILPDDREPLVIQAVSGGAAISDAVEHCYFLFGNVADVDKDHRVAVLPSSDADRFAQEALAEVARVAFVDDASLRDVIDGYLNGRRLTSV